LAINKEGKKIDSLEAYQIEVQTIDEMAPDPEQSLTEDSLTRFDQPKKRNKQRNKNRNSGQNRRKNQNKNRENN